jgi:sigma-B regulation protein RsbU (phosphoserine phosphatase)
VISPAPYKIRCAEIWGGVTRKQAEIETPGVRAAIYSSAGDGQKGGDVYYFSVCSYETLTRVAIADVRGHGEAVSHISEWLCESLENHMNDDDGAAVLASLNAIVHARGFEALTTAAIATIHRDRGQLCYASAGHPPLLHWSAGREWRPLETNSEPGSGPMNLPLGVAPATRYVQQQLAVRPGDRLFLYTDGVADCPGPGDVPYGDRALFDLLSRDRNSSVPALRDSVARDLTEFSAGPLEHDDVTFLFVEVLSPAPLWRRRIFPGKGIAKDKARQDGRGE